MDKQYVISRVNNELSNYWWGGEVVDAHLNEQNEWIVDCKIHLIGEWGGKRYKSGDYIIERNKAIFTQIDDMIFCNLCKVQN